VYLTREMYIDRGERFAVGDVVAWDVILVDGVSEGWPPDRLVDTRIRIEAHPSWAVRGALAVAPELSACWRGHEPVGSVRPIKAGLVADFFNPPFYSTINAEIRGIEVVARRSAMDATGVWQSSGPWRLSDVPQTPGRLTHTPPDSPGADQDDGLLFDVAVASCAIRPYELRSPGPYAS
jgi:hypothetical protein